MKKIKDKLLSMDSRSLLLLALIFLSAIFGFTVFRSSLIRVIQSAEDLITSFLYWFFFCFEGLIIGILGYCPSVHATVRELPTVSFQELLNIDLVGLTARLTRFPEAFLSMFYDYNVLIVNVIYYVVLFGSNLLLIVLLIVFLCFKLMMGKNDLPNGHVSLPARIYLGFLEKVLTPMRKSLSSFLEYMCKHKLMSVCLILVWAVNLNLISPIFEAVALYYYFISSFDLLALAIYLLVLMLDILVLFLSMPMIYWLMVGGYVYYRVCEARGLDDLRHMEAKNCGFIKTLDIVVLITGEPGTGKTTTAVDMIQSTVNIFKSEDLDTMMKYEMYFPAFPFAMLREEIDERRRSGEFYCLPNVEDYVDVLMDFYEIMSESGFLWGYSTYIHGDRVDVGNRDISLRHALKEYGKAYFEYMTKNPVISNFPIRLDGDHAAEGRLKLWDGDFFRRKEVSRYAHILNQDMLRHGVKVDPTGAEIGMFGPSVIGWTEISKDLGNQNTNAHLKADSMTSNAKNEKSIYSFMLARHAKTLIDNNVHIRFFTDDQRASNVMAAAVGLMSVLTIKERSETLIAIPGMDAIFILNDAVARPFEKLLKERESVRGDITLSFLIIKRTAGFIRLLRDRIVNRYGYEEITLVRQQGSAYSGNTGVVNATGAVKEHKYYKSYMKVYSDRFPSDIFSEAYATAQKAAGRGIDDIPEYKALYPSLSEMEYQRSRLTSDIIKAVTGVELMGKENDP